MPNRPLRIRRIADQIQRELSDILHAELRDPGVGMITITGVEVSPDLAYADVFYTALGDAQAIGRTRAGLRRASGFLRSALGSRIKVHNVPELRFHFDESVERGMQLTRLIESAVSGGKSGQE